MENLIIAYRDPLFGLILFFAVVAIISLSSYIWGRMAIAKSHESVTKFLEAFEFASDKAGDFERFLEENKTAFQPMLLLAQAYEKSGEFDKAIKIYLSLLSCVRFSPHSRDKSQLLERLGRCYFKAGFLFKARTIFLEAIALTPRQSTTLLYLSSLYVTLKEYERGLEVLDALQEQDINVQELQAIFQAMTIIDAPHTTEQKLQKLLPLFPASRLIQRMALELAFVADTPWAWQMVQQADIENLYDLLWYLDEGKLDLGIISAHPKLVALFAARGLIEGTPNGENFEADALIAMREAKLSTFHAMMTFEYLCGKCKRVLPLHFVRCPHCLAIGTCIVETQLSSFKGGQ